jgi:beta-1,4-mannosyl-glycoprotein beta-1,4-N-acetylglucosaminyltransferase
MIVDCFSFFNELDLLELRLGELDPVVDQFVLAEAVVTHQGSPKPLFFQENRVRFGPWLHKIAHVVLEAIEAEGPAAHWVREAKQRNALGKILDHVPDDAIVMVSDLDEIPTRGFVRQLPNLADAQTRVVAEGPMYATYLNGLTGRWLGTTAARVPIARKLGLHALRTAREEAQWQESGRSVVPNGGWHFSFIGSVDDRKAKAEAWGHAQDDGFAGFDYEAGEAQRQIFGQPIQFVAVDADFPVYLRENRARFAHLIR